MTDRSSAAGGPAGHKGSGPRPVTRHIYIAVETTRPGLFGCGRLGLGVYSERQLREWAERVQAELVIVRRDEAASRAGRAPAASAEA